MKRLFVLFFACLLLAGCGVQPEPDYDEPVLVQAGAYTLTDGTQVDVWQTAVLQHTVYQTPDGMELLWIPEWVDIANVHVVNMTSFEDLNETARTEIRNFYKDNLPELDVQVLLENAWSEYCAPDRSESFSGHYASQCIYPCAENDALIAYCVETTIPIEGSNVRVEYFNTIFERQTGEVIGFWDLFKVDEEETADYIAEKLAKHDGEYHKIRKALTEQASVRIQQGGFEFMFPAGSIYLSEYDAYMYLSCEELEDILHPWAITEEFE